MTEHRVQIEIPAITLGIELPEDISQDHARRVISEAIRELGGPVREFTASYLSEAVNRLLSQDDPQPDEAPPADWVELARKWAEGAVRDGT